MNVTDLTIASPGFEDGTVIPAKYTADGENINPELNIEDFPSETKSMVLIVDDPDAPIGIWTHWIVFNIPVNRAVRIEEDSIPGIQGINDFKQTKYGGPSPPKGTHRYFFRVYALDTNIPLKEGAFLSDLKEAMKGHILAEGELMGTYSR